MLCVLSTPVLSANVRPYAGISVGASDGNSGKGSPNITYVSGVPITDNYPVNDRNILKTMISINGGYEYEGAHLRPAIALGLGLYTTPSDFHYKGHVVETITGDAADTLYRYSYNIKTTRLMAEAQFSWLIKNLLPFISIGVGPSWNRFNNYTESPVNSSGFVALPPFESHTNHHVAYQAGFGLGYDYCQERFAIGYRYVNLGQISSGTRGSEYPYALKTGLFTTNDIYLSYTHLF